MRTHGHYPTWAEVIDRNNALVKTLHRVRVAHRVYLGIYLPIGLAVHLAFTENA